MDEEETTLKLLATDTHDSFNGINLIEEKPMDHLSL